MKIKSFLAVALTFICGFAYAQMQMPQLPLDPATKIGKLDNGLTYYIRYNNWPENRANFYIAQKVGSIQEEESQRGLAHFLEHMAFNGSDNFKGNELIEWCRSKGIEFGGDLNAYTSIDQTVYNISNVPTTNKGTIDSCLLILRDWSTGLTLDPQEIDKERGVIHEEWRLRTSAQSRMLERNLEKLYPGSKYGRRYPIGLMSVIDNFKPKELRDYYEKWYHPTNQGLIIVGDVNVDEIEAKIKELFGGIKNPEKEAPVVDEQVPDNAQPIVIIDKDKEYRTSDVDLMVKHEVFPDSLKNTMAYYVYNYLQGAASSMLRDRFTEASQKADCPYVNVLAYDGTYLFSKTKDAFTLGVSPRDPSLISQSLEAALKELKRATEHGFTPTEYNRFKENYKSNWEKRLSNKDKRYSSQFYNEAKGHFLTNEPMPDIDTEYQLAQQLLQMIPVEMVNQYAAELFPKNDSNVVIVNFNNEKEDAVYPTEAELLGALSNARAAQVEAYVDNVKNEPLITKMPKAGKIKKETKSDKFDYTTVELSNGVKVLLKNTDFKKDQVLLRGHGGSGSTLYGDKDLINLKAFDDVIGISGLANFSSTELQKALAGKIANANLTMSDRMMNIDGNATPKDVETMLQMVYLYFTSINKDLDAYGNLINQYKVSLKNRELSPEIALSDSITATLYNHSKRMEPMKLADIEKIDYDRILAMAKERTANAAEWTFEIIGHYDDATIRPLICQYLGALPAKGKNPNSPRMDKIQKGVIDNIFMRKQETPKSTAYIVWHNDVMPYSLDNSIKADAAGQVLSMVYLKKIREEASAAYSCGAYAGMNLATDGYHVAQLIAYCPMKPEKKEEAMSIMNEEVQNLAKTCDAEMLAKIKELMLKQIDDRAKTNGYWSNVVWTYSKMGVDDHTDYKKLVETLTPQGICDFMTEFLKAGNKITVAMFPEE